MNDRKKHQKTLCGILCLLFLILSVSLSSYAGEEGKEVGSIIDRILSYEYRETHTENSTQLGQTLTPGSSLSDWLCLALASRQTDLSSYRTSLKEYLSGDISSHSLLDKLRMSLSLARMGETSQKDFVTSLIKEAQSSSNIMVLTYALLNDTAYETGYSSKLIGTLLEKKVGPGWAIAGSVPDIDVTAMVTASLAPFKALNEVEEAAGEAFAFLRERQQDDAGFCGFGQSFTNPESTAQVWLALTAFGIDGLSSDWQKEGNSFLTVFQAFQKDSGGISHTKETEENALATVQTLYALTRYEEVFLPERKEPESAAFEKGTEEALFLTESAEEPEEVSKEALETEKETEKETEEETEAIKEQKRFTDEKQVRWFSTADIIKFLLSCVLFIIALFTFRFLRKRQKKTLILFPVFIACLIGIWLLPISTPDTYYQVKETESEGIRITLVIDASLALPVKTLSGFPEDGVLFSGELVVPKDSDALSALIYVAKQERFQIDYQGSAGSGTAYVKGIQYLYEFDGGDLSGWMYQVNGVTPSKGASQYPLKEGDVLSWRYSLDIGNDL